MIMMINFNEFEIVNSFKLRSGYKEDLKIVLQEWKGHLTP
jgi:hypothetical protein